MYGTCTLAWSDVVRYLQHLVSTVARYQLEADEPAKNRLDILQETQNSTTLLYLPHTVQQRQLPPPPPVGSVPTSAQQPTFPLDSRQNPLPTPPQPPPPEPQDAFASLGPVSPPPTGDLYNGDGESQPATPLEDMVPSIRNPLTSSETFFLVDSSGRQRYLGSSSSLSFTWQIRFLLKKVMGDDVPINLVPSSEEQTYKMAAATVRSSLFPLAGTDTDMPSRSYPKYLAETALYHLGDIFHVFDRDEFMAKIDAFFDDGSCNRPLSTLWHVQLLQPLLAIAFGKLFLRRGASALGPPGATDFLRALTLQNDILYLWADPILKIETLCLTTLYLMSCDMRATAYCMVGTATTLHRYHHVTLLCFLTTHTRLVRECALPCPCE